MVTLLRWSTGLCLVLAFGVLASKPLVAAEDFYKGKQINLIVGSETGAGYDANARLLARHMSKHIPGNPTIVVQNMPGAGGLQAANHIYNIAAKDGTVFGTFQRNLPLMSIVERDNQQVKFDATKFTWLGTTSSGAGDAYMLIVRDDVPIRRIEEVRGQGAPQLIIAATAAGSQSYDIPAMLPDLLGLNLKTIGGYPSAAAMSLAMMRKESDGRMIGLSALYSTQPDWVEKKLVRILLQMGRVNRHPDIPDVPLTRELASNDGDRALIELLDVSQLLSWPFAAPPAIPADRAAILQKAFMDTQQDPNYVAEAARAKMELSPLPGEEIRKLLEGLSSRLTPALLARYTSIVAKIKADQK